MTEINKRIAKVKDQIIETKIMRHKLGLQDYDEIIDDFEVFITTIESLQDKLKSRNILLAAMVDHVDTVNTNLESQKERIEQQSTLIVLQAKQIETLQKENKRLTSALQDIFLHYEMEMVVREVASNSLSTQETKSKGIVFKPGIHGVNVTRFIQEGDKP